MIGKKNRMGAGVRGALDYLARTGKPAAARAASNIVAGNMAARAPRALAKEWGHIRATRPGCKKPVFHFSLSLPPGQNLNDEQWNIAAREFLRGLEIDPDRHQFIGFKHSDRDHEHLHIILNRVPLDGGNLAREKKTTTT